jgi:hypothetical protein
MIKMLFNDTSQVHSGRLSFPCVVSVGRLGDFGGRWEPRQNESSRHTDVDC